MVSAVEGLPQHLIIQLDNHTRNLAYLSQQFSDHPFDLFEPREMHMSLETWVHLLKISWFEMRYDELLVRTQNLAPKWGIEVVP